MEEIKELNRIMWKE